LKGRDNLEDINVDGIRILEWLLGRVAGVDYIYLTDDVDCAGLCEYGNELSVCIKSHEFLTS
jgi:hypothetical protein